MHVLMYMYFFYLVPPFTLPPLHPNGEGSTVLPILGVLISVYTQYTRYILVLQRMFQAS